MAQVAIQLSDETLARVKARAEVLEVSAEQVIADEVEAMFAEDFSPPHDDAAYLAFVQQGVDSANRGEVEDWDVVKTRLRAYITDRTAAAAE